MSARRRTILVGALLAVGSGLWGPAWNDRDTMDQRQRDSVTATLPIPGAGVVGGAMDAADAASARAAAHDSLLGGNR
jgi:hypothetical protein